MALNEPVGLVNRFNKIDTGYIITTGNSLILAQSSSTSGAFITTDTSKQVSGYPAGSTSNWQENSSMAVLNILQDSTILYAELIWYSASKGGGVDLTANELDNIKFSTPAGNFDVSPSNSQRELYESSGGIIKVFRSADVTNLVSNGGSGNYTVSKVPGVNGFQWSGARCGWALTVVVRNNSQPYRVLRVDTGVVLTYNPNSVTTTLSNFSTPSSGTVKGRLNVVAADGEMYPDASFAGSSLSNLVQLGNTVGTGNNAPSTSPYNPYNNIFCGSINIADPLDPNVGKLDTRGTLGNANHNPFTLDYSTKARNRWDITSLDLSSALTTNQTQLIIKNSANGSGAYFEFIQASVQVDALAPSINFQYSVDKSKIYVGEILTYSGTVTNNGGTSSNNTIFWDFYGNHEVFISGSVVVNGSSQSSANPSTGISLGNISPGQTITFSYKIQVIKQPSYSPIARIDNWGYITYDFNPVANTTISGRSDSNKVLIDVLDLNVNKIVDREYAGIGYTLTYSVTIQNLGYIDADNLKLTTNIPSGTSFISDSLKINSTSNPGINPADGTILSAIPAQSSITVSWKIQVGDAIPEVNPVTCMTSIDTQTGIIKNTNTVASQINHVDFTVNGIISQSVDKPYADLNEIITYTITLKNSGNVIANNVYMQDTIPSELLFQSGSITINGVTNNSTPDALNILTVGVGQTKTIVFKAKVKSLPNKNPLENVVPISYAFTINPAEPNAIVKYISTNKVTTEVNNANLSLLSTANKRYVDIEDFIIYSIKLENVGNTSANNIIFTNPIPNGTSFVNGSVSIGGVSNSSANPSMGINIGTISAYSSTNVSFKIKVGNVIPSLNPIQNKSTTTFNYIVNPNNQPVNGLSESNIASINVNHADLISEGNFIKTIDKAYADLDEIITYTITVKNTGNVSANNVEVIDQLISNLSFQAGTLTIDGVSDGSNPTDGITLGEISSTQTKIIVFKVKVNSIPSPNPISNVASINYNYTVDPIIPNDKSAGGATSQVTTQINHGELLSSGNVVKSVDKSFAKVDEVLTYNVKFKNTGNVSTNNVMVNDILPPDVSFITGSVNINGTANSSANPSFGVNIGSINPNSTTTLVFQVKVISLPLNKLVSNKADFNYNYTVNPAIPNSVSKSSTTNSITTTVAQPDFKGSTSSNFIKEVDKIYADIGDIVTYTLTVINSGNTSATSVVLTDIIQPGAIFKSGTVIVDGATKATDNPNLGINLGSINVNQTVVVSYKVEITSLPVSGKVENFASLKYNYTLNPINPNRENGSLNSNTVTTIINHADLTSTSNFIKSSDKQFADLNEIVTYTITVKNTGNVSANNVTVKDIIPTGVSYQTGTLTVNGTSNAGDISSGVNIGSITKNATSTLIFKVKVISIPSQNPIENKAQVTYSYTVNPTTPNGANASGDTNIITTKINNATLNSVKSTNKAYADLGETITYTVLLTNTGNVNATNVIFKDAPPDGTSFVDNSVAVASLVKPGESPLDGVNIGTIPNGGTVSVSFQIKVGDSIPSQNPIQNKSQTDYNYNVDPGASPISKTSTSNIINTQIRHADLISTGNFTKSVDEDFVDLGAVVTYTINVKNSGNTPANNVIVTDVIGNGATYKTGTLTIDGASKTDNLNTGINVGSISSNQTKVIVFSVDITSLPTQNPINNSASVTYAYTVNPANPNGVVNNGITNNVTTRVNHAELLSSGNAILTVDKNFGKLNEVLTYSITLKNTGNADASNILITDVLQQEISFVAGSVKINDVTNSSANPIAGITIAKIEANKTTVIVFKANIKALPASQVIDNTVNFKYSYVVDPQVSNIITKNGTTNSVQSTVIQPGFTGNESGSGNGTPDAPENFVLAVNKQYADIGDLITYTFTIKNSGNTAATNVILKNILPSSAEFKLGTVLVGGTSLSSASPVTGINIGTINPNQTVVASFKATVVSVPQGNYINNKASLTYNYTLDPAYPNREVGSLDSNSVSTMVTTAKVLGDGNFVKTVDKDYADIGDILSYTVTILNSGSIPANNVIFKDVIPSGVTIEAGSLKINNISNNGNLGTGINIGSINPDETKTIAFKVKVTSVPTENPIKNKSSLDYTYTTDPSNPNNKAGSGDSNIVTTQINTAKLISDQTVNKSTANLEEIITYTTKISNAGNITANEVVFKNNIPDGTTFVADSLISAGAVKPGVNPSSGFTIGNINQNSNIIVSFKVKVGTSIPTQNPVQNKNTTTYSYLANPNQPKKTGISDSNQVETQIVNANLLGDGDFTNSVDKAYADIGYVLTYTVKVRNSGNINANNVIVTDSIPAGSVYKTGTLTINGVLSNNDPNTGINLDTITPKQTKIILFKVDVTGIPPENPLANKASLTYNYTIDPAAPNAGKGGGTSNTVTTQINHADLSPGNIIKSVDKKYAKLGDELTYTISFKNSGNVDVNNIIVKDQLNNNLSFISGSIFLNDVSKPNDNIIDGINIGTVSPNAISLVKFKAQIISLPSSGSLTNQASFTSNYTIDPATPNSGSIQDNTNPATITVVQAGFGSNTTGGSSGGSGSATNDNFIKTVDKQYADIGDILTYTLTVKNSGNSTATNVILKDNLTNGITFKNGTVIVDGVERVSDDPSTGIILGNVISNQTVVVTFKGTVVTIPTGNSITNKGTLTYNYTLDPAYPDREIGTIDSNTVSTMVTNANVLGAGNFVKAVDKAFGGVGDILTYTTTIKNTGVISANNVIFKDPIPQGTTYEIGSLKINDVSNSGNLNTGVNIGSISSNETKTIVFKVKIASLPTINPIRTKSNISYTYTVDPANPNAKSSSGDSNIVSTQVNTASLTSDLTVNKASALLNDIITYTTKLTNTGNVAANEVLFKDTIPSGVTFIDNSLTLNGVLKPGADPNTGFNVGTINSKAVATIAFNVKVGNTVPAQNPVQNNNKTTFTFLVESLATKKTGSVDSNLVGTQIVNANLLGDGDFVKTVDKAFGDIGYVLTYTIKVRNSGNINANNVVVIDPVPTGAIFKSGTLTINGVLNNSDPNIGINLDTIASKQTKIIVFQVEVTAIPPENPISNKASLSYNYTVDPTKPNAEKGTGLSNAATTQINHADLGPGNIVKSVDRQYAKLGDELTYTISFKNAGNTVVNDVIVKDNLSNELSFVPQSIILNDIAMPNDDIVTGINIGSVAANSTSLVKFKAQITGLPSSGNLTNQATFNCKYTIDPSIPNGGNIDSSTNPATLKVIQAGFGTTSTDGSGGSGGGSGSGAGSENFVKTVDKQYADIGEILTYTLTIKNSGNTTATNVILKDNLTNGITFKSGSVIVDGIDRIADDPTTGILLGNIQSSQTVVVKFKGTVISIPVDNSITNKGILSYNYTLDPAYPDREIGSLESNTVSTIVKNANILGTENFVKSVDKASGGIGDLLTYTVNIKNSGMISANNVIFKDPIPQGTTYETGSLKINNISNSGDLNVGVNIGTINPNETKIITFKVKITSLPTTNPIKSKSNVSYTYAVDPASPNSKSSSGDSNIVSTQVNAANIVSEQTVNKATANLGDVITYTTKLTNSGNVSANEILFKDTIPNGVTFVDNSLILNGVLKTGANPTTGFNVGTINPRGNVVIAFNVKVGNTVPIQNPIQNNNKTTFTFIVESVANKRTGSVDSNTVGTQIVNANLLGDGDFVKTVDKAYGDIGYLLTYTIKVRNSGNITANNVIVMDPVPTGTIFKVGSLTINGVISNGNPNTGINLDTIPSKQTKIIVFKVEVISIPPENPISNKATLSYNYTVDPTKPNAEKGTGLSNSATTQINHADLGPGNIIKSVDKTFASLGDELTYTISFKNSGNTIVNDVIVKDALSSELSFIPESIILNDIAMPNDNIITGVNIGTVAPNQTSIIKFRTKIVALPSSSNLTTQASFKCNYTIDPETPNGGNIESNINPPSVTIVQAGFNSTSTSGGAGGGSGSTNDNFVKTVDKQYADIGDILTYTLKIKNSGNTRATNVILKDDLTNGITFNQGSVTVDGIDKISDNPKTGIILGYIEANQIITVTFKGTVSSVPNGNYISNKGNLTYNYTLDPAYPDRETGSLDSNEVSTMITNANILGDGNFVINADKEFLDIEDILTYTVNITNSGMISANNVIFKDTLPQGLTYETASLKINNISNSGNLSQGVNIGLLNSSETKIVVFKAKVTSLPQDGLLKNKANISYTYTVNPDEPNGKSKTGDSNIITTKVNTAKITSEQSVNKQTSTLKDIITYSVKLTNIGNVTSNEVIFKDTLPNGLSFISDSLSLNGVLKQNANPTTGFTIGSINAKSSSTVVFKAKVSDTLPSQNPIKNSSKTTFSYLINPSGTKKNGISDSNVVETQIVNANLLGDGNFTKTVDKAYADVLDVLTYTITIKNTGNITANNVILTDQIPNGASYKPATLTINGISKNDNPNIGVNIGEISPNQIKTIVFNVQINEIPTENPISNRASLTYNYTIDPTKPNSEKGYGTSNFVETQINHADILSEGNIIKSVDKTFAKVGDELTYTITFKNTGNIPINDVIVTDELSSELSFISGSILVDDALRPNDNLLSGVNIGTIASNGTAIVKFKAKIESLPESKNLTNQAKFKCNYTVDPSVPNGVTIETNTNPINITVVQAGFGGDSNGGTTGGVNSNFNHTVDKLYADIGDVVTYTFNIKNSGNIPANNVILKDVIEEGSIFKQGSVSINGITKPFDNPNIGINLSSIYPNQTVTVVFKTTVTTIPQSGKINNSAKLAFVYTLDPNNPNGESQILTSNQTSVTIVHGEVSANNALKSANKIQTTLGDIITYTISAKNTGNIDLLNVTLKDVIPTGTSFINGSVLINGIAKINENPSLGINIGSISPNNMKTVIFQVKVTENADFNITNTAELIYNYFVNPSLAPVSGSILTNKVVIQNIKPNLEMTTTSDRVGGVPGTVIKYTTVAKNTGRIKINDVVINGSISSKLEYLGNVTINGMENSGDFRMGINVGDLEVNQSAVVTFEVKIKDLSQNELAITILDDEVCADGDNQIINQIQGSYSYNINGVATSFSNTATANSTLDVQVFNPSVVLEKTCNKKIVKEGDTFIYTIMATNNGNIDISEGLIKDNIPNQFSIEEIKIDSQIVQGNIITGLQIGQIAVGITKMISLTVKALSINPTSPVYTNEVIGEFKVITDPNQPSEIITKTAIVQEGITVLKPSLSLSKSVNVEFAALEDIINYTLVAKNIGNADTGNLLLKNITIQDFLTPELAFLEDSLKIDGDNYLNINISDGVNIGNLDVNETKTITFDVKVVGVKNTPIINTASAKYSFNLDPNSQEQISTISSNSVKIMAQNPNLTIIKEVDKTSASLNDILNYTVKIKNNGQLNLINILLKDNIPNITKLIDGSFKLDGKVINSVELDKGISIKNMNVGDEILIQYSSIVTGTNSSGKAENYITVSFSYIFEDKTTGTKEVESNTVIVLINLNSFKQFTVSEYIDVPVEEPDVKKVTNVRGKVEILKYNIIQTSKIRSLEGQELSGYKLIVHGVVSETIEYVANNLTESIHAVNKEIKFSTFIILPSNFNLDNRLEVSAVLEKAYANSSDPRNLFSNATILITARIFSH